MPDILYVLWPPQEWYDFRSRPAPPQKHDAAGNPMWGVGQDGTGGLPLLDFPVLPDRVSSL